MQDLVHKDKRQIMRRMSSEDWLPEKTLIVFLESIIPWSASVAVHRHIPLGLDTFAVYWPASSASTFNIFNEYWPSAALMT